MMAKKITSPVWLLRRFNKYCSDENERYMRKKITLKSGETVEEVKPVPMTLTGFTSYIGIGSSTWDNFTKSDRAKEGRYPEIIDRIKTKIRKDQIEGAAAGFYKENISIRLAELADNQLIKSQKLPPPKAITSIEVVHTQLEESGSTEPSSANEN